MCATRSPDILDRYSVAQVVEVTLRKMRRDGIAPPFALESPVPISKEASRSKADPSDGFLAGLSQLAIHSQETNGLEHL